jgi:multiple sugar transport system ATP-binding protein
MNLLRGSVVDGDGDGLRLQLDDGARLPLPPDRDALRNRVGQPLVVGLRPEDMRIAGEGEGTLPARVEAVEPVGNEAFVNLRRGEGGEEIVLRLPPHGLPAPGDTVRLACDVARMHFFDADSGARID